MPTATRTFRVFVSSTFEDLKAERDALQRDVFPRLRKLCEENNARFQAIDLRWGVRDEAALDQQTMEICLREIERCQHTGIKPNFIVLLGERYGWRPLPARVEAEEFEQILSVAAEDERQKLLWEEHQPAESRGWYRLDLNAVPAEYTLRPREVNVAAGAPEQDKQTARLHEAEEWKEAENYLRNTFSYAIARLGWPGDDRRRIKYEASATHQEILKGLGQSDEDRRHVFAFLRTHSEGATEDPELAALKQDLRNKLSKDNIRTYRGSEIARLCSDVRKHLRKVIKNEMSRFTSRDALDLEIEAHDHFAGDRCRIFVGRKTALDAIAEYIGGPERRPLVVHGESGSGKSAVMAKASEQYKGSGRIIRRFIGATPDSTSGHALLTGLCRQIVPGDTPIEYEKLEETFQERLTTATAEQPLVLFVDALDQLAASDPARTANWLPAELPPHVKVIVSTTDDGDGLPSSQQVRLDQMTTVEGGQVLDALLTEARRTFQPWQREKVLAHFERCALPLYLKLATEESKLWKSYTGQDSCMLGEGIAGVLDTLFDRLATNANHGPVLVERSLGYLATARYGLTEDEVLDVLTVDDAVWDDFDKRKHHDMNERRLPVVVWSRLSLDLEPYLMERTAPGGMVIGFYHRQLAERVAGRFLGGDEAQARHADLALYFSKMHAWLDGERKTPNARRAAELPFQQREARLWTKAEATLFDCPFLIAKVAAGMVLDLDGDCLALLRDAPERELPRRDSLRLIRATLRLSFHVVSRDSEQFASQMRGRLLAHQARADIAALLNSLDACSPRPRLRPLWPTLEAGGGPMLSILKGHCDDVSAVALSGDGKRAVSGSWDMTVRVWDLEGNHPPRVLDGHTGPVEAVALSADGKCAISGSDTFQKGPRDFRLRVWDLESERPPRLLDGHTGPICAVALSIDGKRAASGSWDRTVRVWDLEGNQPPRVLEGHAGKVSHVALSADGKHVVSSSSDGTLRFWDLEGNLPPRSLQGHTGIVSALAFSADGKRVICGSSDKSLWVWDPEGNQAPRVLMSHIDSAQALALSADGKCAISCGEFDNTIRVWDLEGDEPVRVLEGHSDSVLALALSADGKRAVSGSRDLTLRVWDVRSAQACLTKEGHTDEVNSVVLSADCKRAVSGSEDETLRVWDLESDQPPRVLEGNPGSIKAVALSADSRHVVSGLSDNSVRVWDLEANYPPRVLEGHTNVVNAVALTADGKLAVSGSDDKTLRIWDLESNQPLRVLEGHTNFVNTVALSADGKFAVSGSSDNTLRVWDLKSYKPPRVLEGHTDFVNAVALSANGKLVVSGSTDGTLRVWDLEGCQPQRVLANDLSLIMTVALSSDGKFAVSGSWDGAVTVWNLESGKRLAIFTVDARVNSCAWAMERIMAGDRSGKVHFFAWEN